MAKFLEGRQFLVVTSLPSMIPGISYILNRYFWNYMVVSNTELAM